MTSTQAHSTEQGHAEDIEEVYMQQIAEGLDWLEDCFEDCPSDLTADEIRAAVNRHYGGGWTAFLVDGNY
jgi:hypothetical protein